ncbi:HAD family phosphatase [Limosilactobacillus sp. STM2_1]|uniref:HAD family phosphatase n=1 Tax=Limosilactobacillus rudii TaxID=2759755 RepID=A0A7W3UM41_9LACO|nr:HAD family phosphatase [Limosilactobacillus rudii]MBB1078828.1 HAD family phosphatase [Limosilactobacillus rudii]MBB1098097.1 HAD family phosphatase [Limosilactobacillus rudii]MCD7135167.1 HAD family phosphatase [Limosilactobacillus rudii]
MDGAIFSFNNIFVDTDKLSFTSWQRFAIYEFGMGLPEKLAPQFASLTPEQCLTLVLKHFNANPDASEKTTMITEWQKMLSEEADNLNEDDQLPGIKRLLLNLYDHYVKIAVLDTNEDIHNILKQVGLDNYIDSIISYHADKNPYSVAINQLNLDGPACIGIGTTANAITNIHEINAIAIGIGDTTQLSNADYQVVQVGDLRYPMLQKIWEDKH